jgi:putative membrane protein
VDTGGRGVWVFKLMILLTVVLLGAGLTSLNPQSIRFDYYFGVIELPLSLLLVASLSVGGLLGIASSLLTVLEARRDSARLRRKVRLCEHEIEQLRAVSGQGD